MENKKANEISKNNENKDIKQNNVNNENDIDKVISDFFRTASKVVSQANEKQAEKPQTIDETMRTFGIYDRVVGICEKNADNNEEIKKNYSLVLIITLSGQLLFMNIIFILAGVGILKYSDSLIKLYLVGTLGEVVGLVTIIVKYLFKDNLSQSLNIILNNSIKSRINRNTLKKSNNSNIKGTNSNS